MLYTFILSTLILQLCSSQIVHIRRNGNEFPSIETQSNNTPIPIVLWHGMGDNCCHDFRSFLNTFTCLKYLKKLKQLTYVV